MKIQAIIFDFGNVICHFDNRIFLKQLESFSPKNTPELFQTIYKDSNLPILYEQGHMNSNQFFDEIVKIAETNITKKQFRDAYCNIFSPIESTFTLIHQLKKSYKLGLLSNTNPWHFDYAIKQIEIFSLFDAYSLSYEVKQMKPHPAIYLDMLQKLGLYAEETIFIDDLAENVEGAKKVGMQGITYTSFLDLTNRLKDYGIFCIE